jgi:isochorismate synthase
MKQQTPIARVLFRLPGAQQTEAFIVGDGSDGFMLAPFLRTGSVLELKGSIVPANELILQGFFEHCVLQPGEAAQSVSGAGYIELVNHAKERIKSGSFEKVVLAGSHWMETRCESAQLFRMLLNHNPQAFVYAFCLDGKLMIGASPETLLQRSGNLLETEALGGTRTHGVYTEKEWTEHRQIQDYISMILETGGYGFSMGEAYSKKAGRIEHLCTQFRIEQRTLQADLELAKALHPTSAICGLPYQPALNFIELSEGFNRGYYSGYLGPVRASGEFYYFVNLRCAECYSNGLRLFAGAGINAMSVPEDEWEEINNKMQTIAQWLK